MIKPRKKILTRESLLEILKAEYPYLKKEFGVKKMAIFGSFAKGKPTIKSDVDIFVQLEKPLGWDFFRLIDYLEEKLGREVDVLTPGAIRTMRVKRIANDIKRNLINV